MKKTRIDYTKREIEDRKKKLLDTYLTSGYKAILDLGCGSGNYESLLLKKGAIVVGVDSSQNLCKISNSLCRNIVRADGMFLPFKDSAFDVVWASEILEHFPSLASFEELERVAEKWIIATVPNPSSSHYKDDPTHILDFTVNSLENYLRRRKEWHYVIRGIGVEWPAAPFGLKVPRVFKFLTYYFTFKLPCLAPTLGVIGKRPSLQNGEAKPLS